jgi:choline dehydrogenase-like flavoprotein
MIDPVRRRALRAAADRIIPADEWPAASTAGVIDYLERHADGAHRRHWRDSISVGLTALDDEARAQGGRNAERPESPGRGSADPDSPGLDAAGPDFAGTAFADLDEAGQDRLLGRVEAGLVEGWPVSPSAFFSTLVDLVTEGYYTSPDDPSAAPPASWAMIGFTPRPQSATRRAPAELDQPTPRLDTLRPRYDVIVVGAGAGGGAAASVIARSGRSVLVIERGDWLRFERIGTDHVRNHRLSLYGDGTSPALPGCNRTLVDAAGTEQVTLPYEHGYHNNAMTLGGGTRVFGAQAWRFLPDDFAMATRYGTPEHSSLQDWPIGYDDLEPYYERVEWDIGVAGDPDGHRGGGPRRRGYPMPPLALSRDGQILETAAAALEWSVGPVPLLINTVARAGREACERCGQCVGFPCPTDAKNGPYNTVLPAALAGNSCHLAVNCMVDRLVTDGHGRVTGVSIIESLGATTTIRTISAGHVVVACGAIESARLLFNSATDQEPAGLGNGGDQLGRNLQGHAYAGAFGLFDHPVQDGVGPGPGISTLRFGHGNPGYVGGGMLANDFVKLPLSYWFQARPPDAATWGDAGKAAMRMNYSRTGHVMGPTQEIPNPESRVRLSRHVRDRFGLPVAMLSGAVHPETLRTAGYLSEQAARWLDAAGALRTWQHRPANGLSAGQHQAGTLRMGTDPATSVTDPTGRVHGHANLWVADGSVHVTNGSVNPVLTILALAYRTADNLIRTS